MVIKTPIPFQVEYDNYTEPYDNHMKRSNEEQAEAKIITSISIFC